MKNEDGSAGHLLSSAKRAFTYTERRMHRVRADVPCADTPALLENVYEHFTLRTHRLWGMWVWETEHDVERRPIHELIHSAFGG